MFWFFIHAVQASPPRVDSFDRNVNRGSPLSFPVCSNKIIKVGEIQRDFVGVFNKTIIPLALVGYEMIIIIPRGRVGYEMRDSQRGA